MVSRRSGGPGGSGQGWSGPAQIRAAVQRRWDDGSLLREFATGGQCPRIEVPLRGPSATVIGDDLGAAQAWVAEVVDGSRGETRYGVEWTSVGGRHIGRTRVPARAVVSTYAQAWALLGATQQAGRFAEIVELVRALPPVSTWVLANPHRALDLGGDWPALIAAYGWLEAHRGSGAYLRQISAPGVDTKFAERHRSTLAALLGVSRGSAGFVADLGLRAKPQLMRMRLSPDGGVGLTGAPGSLAGLAGLTGVTELAVRPDEARTLPFTVDRALVIENEVTYLSAPVPIDGIVLWGKGFEADSIGRLPWLREADVQYWGDIDTHGFAILNQIRAWLPQTRSVLMDRATLLGHRERWVVEPSPARSRLTRLDGDEAALYEDLVTDRLGDRVRLEQELVDWTWALARLA